MAPFAFTQPRVIICEGLDDERFYSVLIKKRRLPDFQVVPSVDLNVPRTGGIEGIKASLKIIKTLPSLSIVKLLVLAADNDSNGVFSVLADALCYHGFNVPIAIGETSPQPNSPATAIILVPIDANGDLETLCKVALFAKWPTAETCVKEFLRLTKADSKEARWSENNLDKARIHATIAGFNKDDPELTLRDCFKSQIIDVQRDEFDPIAGLVKTLGNGF